MIGHYRTNFHNYIAEFKTEGHKNLVPLTIFLFSISRFTSLDLHPWTRVYKIVYSVDESCELEPLRLRNKKIPVQRIVATNENVDTKEYRKLDSLVKLS